MIKGQNKTIFTRKLRGSQALNVVANPLSKSSLYKKGRAQPLKGRAHPNIVGFINTMNFFGGNAIEKCLRT